MSVPSDPPARAATPLLPVKLAAARAVGALARRTGRGGGTSLPGKLLMRLEPHAIAQLADRLPSGSAVISATNGKTTTAAMASAILERTGTRVVHNRAGANMAGGIASTLLGAARSGGRIDGELGLFEVDEFWLGLVLAELRPRAVALGNLFRDQLDRYGELETIGERWAAIVADLPATSRLVLDADDPLIADLGRGREDVLFFGVEDPAMASGALQHASDSTHCRRCGAALRYDAVYLGHLGRWACPACGLTRPEPHVRAEQVVLDGTRSAGFRLVTPLGSRQIVLPLPGLYNVYNALAAGALCLALGLGLDAVAAGLEGVSAAFGRAETVAVGDAEIQLLLVKNPAGANEILRTLALEGPDLRLLGVLNDRVADGRDVSWIWDADFEPIAERIARVTCSGTRAAELALRLKYAGVPLDRIVLEPDLPRALDDALEDARADGSGRLIAVPTYTALLELRNELARRGHVERFWAEAAAP